MDNSNKKWWIVGGVVVVLAIVWWANRSKTEPVPAAETASVTYACDGGAAFVFSIYEDDTARVRGGSSDDVVLRQDAATKFWMSDDGSVMVQQSSGYTFVQENGVTTFDICRPSF